MRIFQALRALPPLTFTGLAPPLLVLCAFGVLQDVPVQVFGHGASAIGLAAAMGLALVLARNLPIVWSKRDMFAAPRALWLLGLLVPIIPFGLAFVLNDRGFQMFWLAALGGWTLMKSFAALIFADHEIIRAPTRHGYDPNAARTSLIMQVLAEAAFLAVGAWMLGRSHPLDWVAFMTLGHLAMQYMREWLTILIIWRRYD